MIEVAAWIISARSFQSCFAGGGDEGSLIERCDLNGDNRIIIVRFGVENTFFF